MDSGETVRRGGARLGQGWGLLVFVLGIGVLGIYFGYGVYLEKYYVTLYDGPMTRYLEIPPFAQRLSPAGEEMQGRCELKLGVGADHCNTFLDLMCKKKGFLFQGSPNGFVITIGKSYKLQGAYKDLHLILTWDPVLGDRPRRTPGSGESGSGSSR